jgi:hypothetical protein
MAQLIESLFTVSRGESLLPLAAIALIAVMLLGSALSSDDRRE